MADEGKTREQLIEELVALRRRVSTLEAVSARPESEGRKRAEGELRQSEEKYRHLFTAMAQGVVYQNAEGHIASANRAAEAILGLSLEQMQDRTSVDPRWEAIHEDGSAFPGSDHPSMVALRTGEAVRDLVMGVFNPEREQTRWISINAVPLFRPAEAEPYGVFTLFDDITDRRRTQEELRRSEERYRALFHGMLNGFALHRIVVDEHGSPVDYVFLEVNEAFERYTGLRRADVLGRKATEVLPGIRESSFDWIGVYGHVAQSGEKTAFESYFEPLARWYSITAYSPLRDHFVAIFEDITARKQAEEARRKSEATLRSYIEHCPHGVFVTDALGNYVEVGGAACAMTGYSEEELLGMNIVDFSTEASAERAAESFRSLASDGAMTVEKEFIAKDRSRRWWAIQGAALPGGRYLGFTTDITDRKQAEAALRGSEAQLSSALQMARAGHWEYDVERDLFSLNDNFYRIFGTTAAEVGGYELSLAGFLERFCHRDDAARLGSGLRAALESTDPAYTAELEHRAPRPGGEVGHVTMRLSVAMDVQGRVVKAYGVNQDITERRRAEALLAQTDRLASMGLMAAGVGHEINNPLTYVLYNIQMLAADLPRLAAVVGRCCSALRDDIGPERFARVVGEAGALLAPSALKELVDWAQEALEGALRIKNVARSLRTFAREDSAELHGVDLTEPLESALRMASNEIKHRAQLVKELGRVPNVRGSEGKLAQVFLNLLVNAAHAIDAGHAQDNRIGIRSWAEGDAVCVEVSDTGRGIAPETMDRVFDPFFTMNGSGMASGLGLSICRNIVTGLGGDIRVESEVGSGTRFVVRLPVSGRPPPRGAGSAVENGRAGTRARGRILVVDDDAAVRGAFSGMLGRDHEVVTVASGTEGRAVLARDQAFDAILCDLMMPEGTGMELHAWLEREHPCLAQRTVFITGGAFTHKAEAYLARVGNPIVHKPVDEAALMEVVERQVVAARRET